MLKWFFFGSFNLLETPSSQPLTTWWETGKKPEALAILEPIIQGAWRSHRSGCFEKHLWWRTCGSFSPLRGEDQHWTPGRGCWHGRIAEGWCLWLAQIVMFVLGSLVIHLAHLSFSSWKVMSMLPKRRAAPNLHFQVQVAGGTKTEGYIFCIIVPSNWLWSTPKKRVFLWLDFPQFIFPFNFFKMPQSFEPHWLPCSKTHTLQALNPHCDLEDFPSFIPSESTMDLVTSGPASAGLSSFGFGGLGTPKHWTIRVQRRDVFGPLLI